MKGKIEKRLDALEKILNPNPSICGEVIIYDAEEGVPEDILRDDSVSVRIFIPDNHRSPEYELIYKEELKQKVERARIRRTKY
ncbi:hypothetical protein [Methanosarcina sp. UBA5]|uniref:hypothetical protein n=1 Tax=Methanosarcina sp. UBA5 TaxID=1915593 RepID=UPI0025CEAD5E|nr:hypothetical protein [Methanosarcina sp. UBA5]